MDSQELRLSGGVTSTTVLDVQQDSKETQVPPLQAPPVLPRLPPASTISSACASSDAPADSAAMEDDDLSEYDLDDFSDEDEDSSDPDEDLADFVVDRVSMLGLNSSASPSEPTPAFGRPPTAPLPRSTPSRIPRPDLSRTQSMHWPGQTTLNVPLFNGTRPDIPLPRAFLSHLATLSQNRPGMGSSQTTAGALATYLRPTSSSLSDGTPSTESVGSEFTSFHDQLCAQLAATLPSETKLFLKQGM